MTTPSATLRQRLVQRARMIGMFSIISSVEVVEMIGIAGFDFVILDLEIDVLQHQVLAVGLVQPLDLEQGRLCAHTAPPTCRCRAVRCSR